MDNLLKLKIIVNTESFLSDDGRRTSYSQAQGLYDLMVDQLIPSVAIGDKEGDLTTDKGVRIGKWKVC